MFLASSCNYLCPIQWSQVLSQEWRCSWSSADRRCSDYIWVINNCIAYEGAPYIEDLAVNCFIQQAIFRGFFTYCISFARSYCAFVITDYNSIPSKSRYLHDNFQDPKYHSQIAGNGNANWQRRKHLTNVRLLKGPEGRVLASKWKFSLFLPYI